MKTQIATALYLLLPVLSLAQAPVDEDGKLIGAYESQAEVMPLGDDDIPKLTPTELQDLVGPIALYPDDLLAIVLPAAAYPLQLAAAARFLEAIESDPTLQPDPEWDDSIVALLNYPEVVELLNEDLDWTWRLGEAVVAQQTDVISAVESFRDRAYAAGNLRTDEYQTVAREEGVISIEPVSEDVIYVPYYEPARVVYYQPRPAYYYHPRPYPVYYYPYSSDRFFDRGHFWGVTTAFSIGWFTHSLHVHHHSYRSHPYYGRRYYHDSWYRHPTLNVYNNTYVYNSNLSVNWHSDGDRWRAREDRRKFDRHAYDRREGYVATEDRQRPRSRDRERERAPIKFRKRDAIPATTEAAQGSRAVSTYRGERAKAADRARVEDRRNDAAGRTAGADRAARQREAGNRARSNSLSAAAQRARKSTATRPEASHRAPDVALPRPAAQATRPRASEVRERREVSPRVQAPQARQAQPRPRESSVRAGSSSKSQASARSRTPASRPSDRRKPRDRQH